MDKLEYRVDNRGVVGVKLKYFVKRNENIVADNQPYSVVSTIMPLGNNSSILEPCILVDNQFKRASAYPNTTNCLYYIFNEIMAFYKASIYYNRRGVDLKCDTLQADARTMLVVPKSEKVGNIEFHNWVYMSSDLVPYIKSQIIRGSSLLLFKEAYK